MFHAERLVRNEIILKLSKRGFSQSQISDVVNLGQSSVGDVLKKGSLSMPLSVGFIGRMPRLIEEKLWFLPSFLKKGSEFYGFTGAYWTHKRVKYVIETEFGVCYEVKQVGRLLKKIGWTWQKPQKKEIKQDLAKVKKWHEEELPALKEKAKLENYEIYYHDESTVQVCANVVKTYAPCGETPILPLYDTKGYQYACIASSINEQGKMYYEIRNKSFKGEAIITYLKALLTTTTQKILLIWDNATWHKSQEVKDFLNTEIGKRLWVANTPPYSPELNPSELIWANLKKVEIPNICPKNITELNKYVNQGLLNIKQNHKLVASFFNS